MVKTINSSPYEAEFELVAIGVTCPHCRSRGKKEVYRCLGPSIFLLRCLRCERPIKVQRVFKGFVPMAEGEKSG